MFNPLTACDTLLVKFAAKYPATFANILPADKCLHALVGISFGALGVLCVHQWPAAAFAGLVVGCVKEFLDAMRGKGFDTYDILATTVGAALASPLVLLFH